MLGLEILDVILGLVFVYFLLSLVCSAVNEYLASLLNKRGKVLKAGIERLLKDSGLLTAFYAHPLIRTYFRDNLTLEERERVMMHGWPAALRRLYQLLTWIFHPSVREARYPSYIPARTVAMALQAVYDAAEKPDVDEGDDPPPPEPWWVPWKRAVPALISGVAVVIVARLIHLPWWAALLAVIAVAYVSTLFYLESRTRKEKASTPESPRAPGGISGANQKSGADGTPPTTGVAADADAEPGVESPAAERVVARQSFQTLMKTLEQESAVKVAEIPALEFATAVAGSKLGVDLSERLIKGAVGLDKAANRVQDSLEVWFNQGMDRVSGAYKRHTQYVLFWIGLVVAIALNADTLDMWRRLSTDEKLREGLATQAVAYVRARDSVATQTDSLRTATDSARAATTRSGSTATDSAQVPQTPADSAARDSAREADRVRTVLTAANAPSQERAKARYDSAMAELKRTGLNLGWRAEDAAALGILRRKTRRELATDSSRAYAALLRKEIRVDSIVAYRVVMADSGDKAVAALAGKVQADSVRLAWNALKPDTTERGKDAAAARVAAGRQARAGQWVLQGPGEWEWGSALWSKLLGLVITAIALSLGAPFWFDMLNKIINIRTAGRAPHELPRKPEAPATRVAEMPR